MTRPAGEHRDAPGAPPPAARWPAWARLALLLALPLVLVGPALLPGKRFLPQVPVGVPPLSTELPDAALRATAGQNFSTADRLFPTLTDQLVTRESWLSGELRNWDPDISLGIPLFAQSIAGFAYPPNWLAVLLPPDLAAGPLAILSLFLAGLGLWLFLARLELPELGCAAGALTLQAGGWGIANLHDFMKVDAALWLPWGLWAIAGIARGARGAPLALSLATGLPLLAGFPPIAVYTLCGVGLYALFALGRKRRELALAAGSIALGLGIGCAHLLPMLEASQRSVRQERDAEVMANDSLPPALVLGTIVPDLVGAPDEPVFLGQLPVAYWLSFGYRDERPRNANALEWNTFVGVAAVLLALAAIAARPRASLFPLALLLLTYGYVFGLPVARWLYHVPGLNLGGPSRALSLAWVAWPWLAALGAGALVRGCRRGELALMAASAAIAAVAGYAALTLEPAAWANALEATLVERHGFSAQDVRKWFVTPENARAAGARLADRAGLVALVSLAIAAAALVRRLGHHRAAIAIVAGTLLVEGALTAAPHVRARDLGGAPLLPRSETIEAIRKAAGDGRVLRLDTSESGVQHVELLARPNLLHAYGVSDLTPYLVFTPATTVRLFTTLDGDAGFRTGFSRIADPAQAGHRVLDLARVTALLSRTPIDHPRLEPVLERDGFHVYRRAGALPPARVVARGIETSSEEELFQRVVHGELDLATETALAPGVAAGPPPPDGWTAGRLTVERPAPGRLDVLVEDTGGGWLVMHGAWYPGWKCTVDGNDAEVVRADGPFRAVRIPAGKSIVVRTFFEPWSHRIGVTLSLASLAVALLLQRRRSRRS